MVVRHRKVIYYAGGDSASGPWDVEKDAEKMDHSNKKVRERLPRGPWGAPGFLLAPPQESRRRPGLLKGIPAVVPPGKVFLGYWRLDSLC